MIHTDSALNVTFFEHTLLHFHLELFHNSTLCVCVRERVCVCVSEVESNELHLLALL